MHITQIKALTSATIWYFNAVEDTNEKKCITFALANETEEVVAELADILAQGTVGHNTNVSHVEFQGGGFLPTQPQSGKSITVIIGDFTYKRESYTRVNGNSEEQHYQLKEIRFHDWAPNRVGPCDIDYFDYGTVVTHNRLTGEHTATRYVGNYSHIHYMDHPNANSWNIRYTQSSVNKIYRESSGWPDLDIEGTLMRGPFSNEKVQNLVRARISGSPAAPEYNQYSLGDVPYMRGGWSPYLGLMEHVKASAFIAACNEFPKQADNQIANMAEVLDLLKVALNPAEVVGSTINALRRFGSLWMWWRYALSTSKSDIFQAIDYKYRRKMSMWQAHRYDGFAAEEVQYLGDPVSVSCHCGFKARIRPSKLYSNTQWERGVELNPYVIWDMIPMSFVVDWFLDVGDKLQLRNDLRHFLGDYDFFELFFTTDYEAVVEKLTQTKARTYTRDYSGIPSILRGSYVPSEGDPSIATVIKRGIDVLSLVQII